MFMELDLSSFASVEAFATKFKVNDCCSSLSICLVRSMGHNGCNFIPRFPNQSMNIPLHILVCNAGINAYTARKMAATTDDGFNTISQVG